MAFKIVTDVYKLDNITSKKRNPNQNKIVNGDCLNGTHIKIFKEKIRQIFFIEEYQIKIFII